MSCQDVRPLLQIYLDNELDAADARPVAEHLEACADCHGALEAYRRQNELFRRGVAELNGASSELRARVLRGAGWTPRPSLGWASAVAAALVLAAASLGLYFATTVRPPLADPALAMVVSEHRTIALGAGGPGSAMTPAELSALASSFTDGRVREVSVGGLRAVSGHPCQVGETAYAHLVFRTESGALISVYLCSDGAKESPEGGAAGPGSDAQVMLERLDGRLVAMADTGGVRRVAVGDPAERDAIIAAVTSIR